MKIWSRIKQLSIGQLGKLAIVFLQQPLLIFPTLRATQKTFAICNALYGYEHHKSNKANAFRHALWNVLICKNAFKRTKNKQKSVFWAQKITDLYEKVTNNTILDEAMDLHNNAVGRICFLNLINATEEETIAVLQIKATNAKRVSFREEIMNYKLYLIYISE